MTGRRRAPAGARRALRAVLSIGTVELGPDYVRFRGRGRAFNWGKRLTPRQRIEWADWLLERVEDIVRVTPCRALPAPAWERSHVRRRLERIGAIVESHLAALPAPTRSRLRRAAAAVMADRRARARRR